MNQLSDNDEHSWSDGDTPTPMFATHGWSDTTLTSSLTGRSSFGSWEEDEGIIDRLASEQVGRMFEAIDQALYDGISTNNEYVDQECTDWRNQFPHLRIEGVHLLDSLDDGTEIVDPILIERDEEYKKETIQDASISDLIIVGHAIKIYPPPCIITGESSDEIPGLHYEEIIASDGVVEEYFAYNTQTDEGPGLKRSHRYRRIPPITPSACLRDAVFSMVFDQIWSEVAVILYPLLVKYKTSRRNSFSEGITLIPPHNHVPIHEFYLPTNEQLPPPTRAGHIGTQSLKRRPIAPSIAPGVVSHTTDLPNLQKVMTIKPVSLQHRIPSSTLPPPYTSSFPAPIEGSGSMIFHDVSLISTRPSYQLNPLQVGTTPLPPRASETKIISGKMGNRRNPLKPLEVPRTPGLPFMDEDMKDFSGLRGQRLVRHTQLPPIDPSQFDVNKSPQLPRSSDTRGRVTFSNRIVSAIADGNSETGRSSRRQSGIQTDLRPNTSQTLRSETLLVRRGSNHSIGLPPTSSSPIKIIGYAANLHSDSVLWEEQEEGLEEMTQPTLNASMPRSGHHRSKLTRGAVR